MVKQNKQKQAELLWIDLWENDKDNDISTPFNQSAVDFNILADLMAVGALFAGAYTVGSLLEATQQEQIRQEIKDVQSTAPDELISQIGQTAYALEEIANLVTPDTGVTVDGEVYQYLTQDELSYYTLSQNDITQYTDLQNELSFYGRVSDPKGMENIAFENAQSIQEQIGLFGAVEGQVQGTLEPFQGEDVLIPWETEGDLKVCDDCLDKEAEGPYPPDEYPPPQHYGDRCTPGEAELA